MDNTELVRLAALEGMLVKFQITAPGLGWVYCKICRWGLGEKGEDRKLWLADLAQYCREPYGCSPCAIKRRNEPP